MDEGAGGKMEERGNDNTNRYVHKMKSCVHKLKCRLHLGSHKERSSGKKRRRRRRRRRPRGKVTQQ